MGAAVLCHDPDFIACHSVFIGELLWFGRFAGRKVQTTLSWVPTIDRLLQLDRDRQCVFSRGLQGSHLHCGEAESNCCNRILNTLPEGVCLTRVTDSTSRSHQDGFAALTG